jgi:tight adherence protein C
MLLALAVVCLSVAAYLVGETLTQPARERLALRRRASSYGRIAVLRDPARERFTVRVVTPLKEWLAARVLRAVPRTSIESVADKLLAAGLGGKVSAKGFLAAKGAIAIGGAAVGLLFGAGSGVLAGILAALTVAGIGFMTPDILVGGRAKRRREQIRAELPDALDLLAVSVEAGLGFDGAITKVTENLEGALTEEFALALNEMRIGESRQDALKKLADRTGTPELASFTRAIIQADQLGISLGRVLRVQATDTRLRRQAAAEERAMKTPIKMLFPTVAFIFPAMFLVILGPALLNLMKIL